MTNIKKLRDEIDCLDDEIKKLFLERMEICRDVGKYKQEHGMPVLDAAREKMLLDSKTSGLSGDDKETIKRLFMAIMDISKEEQRRLVTNQGTVAYCGSKGAYTYFAAKTVSDKEPISYQSFLSVIRAVESGEVDFGVLPIENNTAGSVLEVYDLLGENSVFIVGETVLPIDHCILGTGTRDDIEKIMSHPQALSQCGKFLIDHRFALSQNVNTAIAARECSELRDPSLGVIASRQCGELYGLNVLWDSVADRPGNKTRFVVISRSRYTGASADKVTLTFTLPHRQGSLIDILNLFANANLTKIESRPLGDFEYRFYLDFISKDPDAVITKVAKVHNTIRVLGIFPSSEE